MLLNNPEMLFSAICLIGFSDSNHQQIFLWLRNCDQDLKSKIKDLKWTEYCWKCNKGKYEDNISQNGFFCFKMYLFFITNWVLLSSSKYIILFLIQ